MSTPCSIPTQLSRREACALGLMSLAGLAAGCASTANPLVQRVESAPLGSLPDGRAVQAHTLHNRRGLTARIMDYGATVLTLDTPDRQGKFTNVLCGENALEPYLKGFPAASVIGRVANRISNARFTLDGREVRVTANAGRNHIHGGNQGFASKLWQSKTRSDSSSGSVILSLTSPDGEEGYPGTLKVTLTYTLNDADELVLHYSAVADQPTVLNLTNHAYFNLAGSGDVYGHQLQIFADEYTPSDRDLIPTGEIKPLAGTPMDFREPHAIGERIAQVQGPSGYDHNFIVRGRSGSLRPAARVVDPKSGRVVLCSTTEPAVQLYTANHFNGKPYPKHGAFCLETQHYPDSPNQPKFPSIVLRPGQTFTSETRYKFSVIS